jgi:hypothetical protein
MPTRRSTLALFFGAVFLAAAFFAAQPKPGSPSLQQSNDKLLESWRKALLLQQPAEQTSFGPLVPIHEFLGLKAPSTDSPAKLTESAEKKLYEWPSASDIGDYKIRFLIACVPDPMDSGFAYWFDQVIEALQRALGADSFVIDRMWLPWHSPESATPHRLPARLHEKHPGLILFRSGARKRLLALLLVGETPTAGAYKAAFRNAIRVIHGCPVKTREEQASKVRIIGPYFSGSSVSLNLALRAVGSQIVHPAIKVVCGSARGFNQKVFQEGWTDANKQSTFERTILPDELVFGHVWDYLKKQTRSSDQVAIVLLQEGNTGFGSNAAQIADKAGQAPEGRERSDFAFYHIPFPLHISQLRAAYTREQLARLESQGLPHAGRNLPFPRTDSDNKDAGTVRARDPLMTATANDLVLNNMVTTLAQKRARRICLLGTDPQDIIFLARLIRDRHPDVQLVTLGTDLLFTHEDYTYALRGMIVAGTYPLYPGFQRWSDLTVKTNPLRILFSHEAFQGYYNAALVHLADTAAATGNDKTAILERMLDYGWEPVEGEGGKKVTLPPIWISVVGGNGQLIPVEYLSPNEKGKHRHYTLDEAVANHVFCREWPANKDAFTLDLGMADYPNMSFVFFLLLLIVSLYLLYHAHRYVRTSIWNSSDVDELCCRYKQRIDFGVVCLAQMLFYGQVAVLFWVPLARPYREEPPYVLGAKIMLVLSLAVLAASYVLFIHVHSLQPGNWRPAKRYRQFLEMSRGSKPIVGCPAWLGWLSRSGFWVALLDVVMLGIATLTLACFLWRVGVAAVATMGNPGADQLIYFERIIHLNNGVTPLLPRFFFCTALFGWGYCLVKKLYLANRCDVASPFPAAGAGAFVGLRKIHEQVRSELMPPSTLRNHFWECALLFAIASVVFVKFYQDIVPPLDGRAYGLITLFGFSLGALLLLFTLLQFYFAWSQVRKLLRFLALLPMQSAFQRLNEKVVALFGGYLHSLRPRHSHLKVSEQQFEQLQRSFPAFVAAIRTAATATPPEAIGELSAERVVAVWNEVQTAFPGDRLGPSITGDFNRELQPAVEEDLEPPDPNHRGDGRPHHRLAPPAPPSHEWGGKTGVDCTDVSRRCLSVLRHFWPLHSMTEAFGQTTQEGHPAPRGYLALSKQAAVRDWAVAAEDFCAIEIARYLAQFIVQLRTLLTSLTVGSLLLLLAATVYPFFPQHQLLLCLTIVAGVTAAAIVFFLVQLNRDEVISRFSHSEPNRFTLDWSFVHGAAAYVLPIVAAFMLQFPIVTSTLRSLLDPLFHVIK